MGAFWALDAVLDVFRFAIYIWISDDYLQIKFWILFKSGIQANSTNSCLYPLDGAEVMAALSSYKRTGLSFLISIKISNATYRNIKTEQWILILLLFKQSGSWFYNLYIFLKFQNTARVQGDINGNGTVNRCYPFHQYISYFVVTHFKYIGQVHRHLDCNLPYWLHQFHYFCGNHISHVTYISKIFSYVNSIFCSFRHA